MDQKWTKNGPEMEHKDGLKIDQKIIKNEPNKSQKMSKK